MARICFNKSRNSSYFVLHCRSLSAMLSTLFFPLIPWLLQLILFSWFVVVLVYLTTSGTAEYKTVDNGTLTSTVCAAAVSYVFCRVFFHNPSSLSKVLVLFFMNISLSRFLSISWPFLDYHIATEWCFVKNNITSCW